MPKYFIKIDGLYLMLVERLDALNTTYIAQINHVENWMEATPMERGVACALVDRLVAKGNVGKYEVVGLTSRQARTLGTDWEKPPIEVKRNDRVIARIVDAFRRLKPSDSPYSDIPQFESILRDEFREDLLLTWGFDDVRNQTEQQLYDGECAKVFDWIVECWNPEVGINQQVISDTISRLIKESWE